MIDDMLFEFVEAESAWRVSVSRIVHEPPHRQLEEHWYHSGSVVILYDTCPWLGLLMVFR